jgi:hypothetical protein
MFFRFNKDEHNRTLLGIMSDIAFGSRRRKAGDQEVLETSGATVAEATPLDAVDSEASTGSQRKLSDILAALSASEARDDEERRLHAERRANEVTRLNYGSSNGEVRLDVIDPPAPPVIESSVPEPTPAPTPIAPPAPQEQPVIDSLTTTPEPLSAAVPEPPTLGEAEVATPIEGLEEFDDAQRRAATHRQAIEALLDEARKVEKKIAAEAAEARATREQLRLEEKIATAARAAERELQAIALANETSQRAERVAAENAQAAEALSAAGNEALSAATAVTEYEISLQLAQKIAAESEQLVREIEERAQRVAVLARDSQRQAEEAERKVAECRAAREAGESDARNAQAVADSLSPSAEALEGLRSLESRVPDRVGTAV